MFHLHVRYRSRDGGGSCASALQYIVREGPFAKRGDTVRWVQSLHMPDWAGGASAPVYWRAAEGPHSRVNARTALLVEFAVPLPLSRDDQDALVLTMAEAMSAMGVEDPATKFRLPLTMAFHEGHGRNPHVHCLLSLSLSDGLVRDEKTWFRRYAPQAPDKGGARRSDYVTKKRWLYRLRETWSRLANAALARCGLAPSLDHRSHADRSLKTLPQIHLGPRISHMRREGLRTARGDRHAAIAARNRAEQMLEVQLIRRRKALQRRDLEEVVLRQAERVWARLNHLHWIAVLQDHPLADENKVRAHATAVLFDANPDNLAAARQAFERQANTQTFAGLVGPDWDTVATPAGFWAVRPGQDEVVLLARGYLATDGRSEESFAAMLKGCAILGFKRPALLVKHGLQALAQTAMKRLGLDWPIRLFKDARGKLAKRM